MNSRHLLFFLFLFFSCQIAFAQQTPDRFVALEQKLKELEKDVPGLSETVDFGVSGASIQEFIRAIAETNQLNISVDPQLNFRVYNRFTGEKVSNVLLFLAREYNLDIRFVGSIMSFFPYATPEMPKPVVPVKEPGISFSSYSELVSLDLKEDTLAKVARKLTQLTKKNVVLAPGLENAKVSIYVESIPLKNALEKLAFANKLQVNKADDDSYFLEPMEVENTANTTSKSYDAKRSGMRSPSKKKPDFLINVKDSMGTGYVTINAIDMPIIDIVKTVSEELGYNYFLFSDIKGNTTSIVSNVRYQDFLSLLLQGTDYTFRLDKDIYLIGERKLEGLRSYKVIQFQFRSFDSMLESIPAELKKGIEIKEFKELNSILLSGSLPQILEVETFLKELDKVVPMITIEVILLDVRKGRNVKTGISAGLKDTISNAGALLPGFDFTLGSGSINKFIGSIGSNNLINLGKVTPKFYVGLSALEQNSNVNVRSVPKLSTLNGHDANLSIGSTRYYSTTTQNVVGSLNPQTVVTQQFTPVQANLAISIKPIVSGDDQVTLNVDVSISDFIGDPPANAPPPAATSQFKSIIRVRNEEMVVLGGLERQETSDNGSGTPILSRIPVIKWLFSSRSKSRNKVISVVFIKPTIVY